MSNVPSVFNTLKDDGGAGGEALVSRIEGEVAAGKEGAIGFAYKDSSGNVVLVQLTTDGKVPVTLDSAGVHLDDHVTVVGDGTRQAVVTLTLTASKVYQLKFLSGACTRTVLWEIEQTDDAAVTIRHGFLTGSGQYTQQINAGCLEFTAGASGTQELTLFGTQQDGPDSDMIGTLCLLQIGA